MGGSDEEIKNINEHITEEVDKLSDKLNDKLENIVEKTGIDVSLVEPVLEIISSTASTVISEGAKRVVENLGLKMIIECSLSQEQKKLALTIYTNVKKSIETFINNPNVNNTIKITRTLSQVIKQLENVNIDGKPPSGADKKAVAIQLGRILIREVMPDDKGEAEVLMVYDMIAESTLEAMIEVSKVVNVAVKEFATKCCPGLLEFFRPMRKL